MKWWGWLLSLLPIVLAWLYGVLASNGVAPNPVLYLRGELAAVLFRAGLLVSVVSVITGLLLNRVRRNHQHQLQDSRQRMMAERRRFLQRLDHELKNPLTAILTGLNNLGDVSRDAYIKQETAAVQTQVRRLNLLVADLRKLAALETIPIEKTEVDLAGLLKDEVEALKEATGREINLMLPSAPWPLPAVEGDQDLLLLAVHNLLDNALKFTDPEDTVEMRASEDSGHILVEVADTGPGIPEEEGDHVWDELYRGQGARGVEGSGLGLALVKMIIERHGGTVGLRSQVGKGTVFSMRLPL
jgi:two-component system OmpR family sensor kinase